jgi:hypothetical protein
MNREQAVEKLIEDNPALHVISETVAEMYDFMDFKPGLTSWAVRPEILRKISQLVESDHRTLETGGGHTTVALAALANHHICINPDVEGCGLIKDYLQTLNIPPRKVRFVLESSDVGLLKLNPTEQIDFAFIDGCHGFPFPAIDWHYIDLHLKVDGILAVDDVDIPSVRVLCDFLEKNGTYKMEDQVLDTAFYRKLKDEQNREWPFQGFNQTKLKSLNCPEVQKNFNKKYFLSSWLDKFRAAFKN